MIFRVAADAIVVLHALFVGFVVCGGFLAWRWPGVMWAHVPAAVWGVAIEFGGWVCPLTPLENAWRARAGLAGYRGTFVDHYILPLLYPAGLTAHLQLLLGSAALLINVIAYSVLLKRNLTPT